MAQWKHLEIALRRQLIEEGKLPHSALWEDIDKDTSTTVELETEEEFFRTFTDDKLGLALNTGARGRIIVKRCVPGSPAASRRIPPGVFLLSVNETSLEQRSLKDAQEQLASAERPVKLRFAQSDASRAIANASTKAAQDERDAVVRAEEERRARAAEELKPVPLETAPTFARTFPEAQLGLCLAGGEGPREQRITVVKKTLPRSAAFKGGIPPGAAIVAINGTSVEFRRLKQVKKLIELAQRPVTIDFSTEEPPRFPQSARRRPKGRPAAAAVDVGDAAAALPAYALRPI